MTAHMFSLTGSGLPRQTDGLPVDHPHRLTHLCQRLVSKSASALGAPCEHATCVRCVVHRTALTDGRQESADRIDGDGLERACSTTADLVGKRDRITSCA